MAASRPPTSPRPSSATCRIKLDKRKVGLLDPIKAVGEYDVPIKLHRDVTVPLKVAVVAE